MDYIKNGVNSGVKIVKNIDVKNVVSEVSTGISTMANASKELIKNTYGKVTKSGKT